MQLYVQAWLLDKDGNRVKQNMAITIHHPEAMTDEKAEQLLESLKDELLQKWGDDYTLESIDFVPTQSTVFKRSVGKNNEPFLIGSGFGKIRIGLSDRIERCIACSCFFGMQLADICISTVFSVQNKPGTATRSASIIAHVVNIQGVFFPQHRCKNFH